MSRRLLTLGLNRNKPIAVQRRYSGCDRFCGRVCQNGTSYKGVMASANKWNRANAKRKQERAKSVAGIGSKDPERAVHESFREMEAIIEARVRRRTAELRAAYERLDNVINGAKLTSIISCDLQGIITIFNAGAERMLGYSASEVVGKQRPGIFHLESEVEERARSLSETLGRPVNGIEIFLGLSRDGNTRRENGPMSVRMDDI